MASFVAPHAGAADRAAVAPRLLEIAYTARVPSGFLVTDRCLWDVASPAGAAAAHAASVAADLRLGPRAAAPLQAALEAALEAAKTSGGKAVTPASLDRGAAAAEWRPRAEPERSGWADA